MIDVFDKLDLESLKAEKQTRGLETRKIAHRVFDNKSLGALEKLMRRGHLDQLEGLVSTGKEANIFYGTAGGVSVAVKIYGVETSEFRDMGRYLAGDKRFGKWSGRRQMINLWAQREFHNLRHVHGKIACPEPLAVWDNVLVMEFIGHKSEPAPKLRESVIEDPGTYLDDILSAIKIMYGVGFVHGDLSEYNILDSGGPVLIDFSQGALADHPMYSELLERDVRNILHYFRKLGVDYDFSQVLAEVKS